MINPIYSPAQDRYDRGIRYRRCGKSGILLPEISLGLWHNFGDVNTLANSLEMALENISVTAEERAEIDSVVNG